MLYMQMSQNQKDTPAFQTQAYNGVVHGIDTLDTRETR